MRQVPRPETEPLLQLPETPSTAEYLAENDRYISQHLTPANAVCTDFDSVQTDVIMRALKRHRPDDFTIVRTKDRNVPALRMVAATAVMGDGSQRDFHVKPWNRHHQSGRYDGIPMSTGQHLAEDLIARARAINLTFEVPADVYTDQDRNHHILLVTEDSTVTSRELQSLTYVHDTDTSRLTPELARAIHDDPHDWPRHYACDTLIDGPEAAMLNILQSAGDSIVAAVMLTALPPGQHNVTRTHQGVTVSVQITRHD